MKTWKKPELKISLLLIIEQEFNRLNESLLYIRPLVDGHNILKKCMKIQIRLHMGFDSIVSCRKSYLPMF